MKFNYHFNEHGMLWPGKKKDAGYTSSQMDSRDSMPCHASTYKSSSSGRREEDKCKASTAINLKFIPCAIVPG